MRSFFAVVALAASAFAQSVNIAIPSAGATLHAGSNFTVAVAKPDTLTGSTDIGIAITLQHCAQTPCADVSEDLGSILYAGAFNPQFSQDGVAFGEPHENFTVQIPAGFQTGTAVLSVPHSVLIGAGPFFFNEIVNVTVNIA